MSSIVDSSVNIQASSQSVPSIPPWFGEITLLARYLQRIGVLRAMEERVRLARRRFGWYGYSLSRWWAIRTSILMA